ALISLDNEINTPRLPSYKRMKKEMDVRIFTFKDLEDQNPNHYGLEGSATQVEEIFPPEKQVNRIKFEDNSYALSSKIYELLSDKKFLL
ncbi:MAG: hypothetical protein PHD05_06660, partial [Sphaerochaetaceae bacterium]|nr:hypothetical protein [Sphaerochaetaceae bacterium]